MDNDDTTEMKSLCLLDREHWKDQQNFGQDKRSSGDSTIPRAEHFRNNMSILILDAILEYSPAGIENDEANKLGMGRLCAWTVWRLDLGLL